MKYAYPALFTPLDNGEYDVYFPDLPHCRTSGHDLPEALEMAADASAMWLWDAENSHDPIPAPSALAATAPQFVNLIMADTSEYRRAHENRAVKKTLTLPSWLNEQAERAGINFSLILQEGLKNKLHISDR
jgi:predicted RNase H-like HicB family nuclease